MTGFGAITPLGHTATSTWEGIKQGRSGIGWITHFDATNFAVKIAGEIRDWHPETALDRKEVRRRDRHQLLTQVAANEAKAHSGITFDTPDARLNAGVCIGSSIGGMTEFTKQQHIIDQHGPKRIAPFAIPSFMTTTGSSMTSALFGLHGPSYILTSACATGSDCIGHAYDQIRLGRMTSMLAGAAEAPILPNAVAGFDRLGACTRETDNITAAVRPFDRRRKGIVMSEAAAVLVLESLSTALARGATIYAEIVGYGTTSDAFHIVAPHPQGDGAARAMQKALDDAALSAADIDYINAHGTATLLNDPMETLAIKQVFGDRAYQVPISSTKSMTGHAMGASAAMEAIFSIMAIQEGLIPPTMHLDEPDDVCDLDYVPNRARRATLNTVMSNAFGFGGHNSVLIFRRYQG